MDVGRQNQKESWIPQSHFRHILPRVIYTDRQGNQLDQASSSEIKGLSGLGECCPPSSSNWEAAARGAEKGSAGNDYVETSRERSTGNTATWNPMSLDDPLLALADAASREHLNPWIIGNYTQEPKWGEANAFPAETTSQFAPVTPDKGMKVESKKIIEMQNLCTHSRNQEFSDDGIVSRGADASGLQTDEELLQRATNSSFAVGSPVLKENHNPDRRDSDVIDLNRTPQQKPRRKKHRPKVINEGKRKGPQKSTTPKSAASTEKPTGKRKYVRKKALGKAPASSPAEANGQSADPKIIEQAKKSCRRALNFDIERQPRDKSSKCSPPFDLDSKPEAQTSAAINQSKSTVFLGRGIEVMVETTQAGIAYDLTHSINQMLKNYVSLRDKEAPSTLFPAQTSEQQGKQDGNLQEKGVDQGIAHDVQEDTAQITPISPNGSNCSTSTTSTLEGQASRSKRKHSEQPDTCSTNLTGIHYNSLNAYQTMPSLLFRKKKRSEKGQTPATSCTSSSVTATKDIAIVETTCPQKDPERDPFTPNINCWISAAPRNGLPGKHVEERIDLLNDLQTFGYSINQTTRSTKKRSRCPTKTRDLASVTRIPGCALHPTNRNRLVPVDCNGQQVGNSHRPHMSVEAVLAEMNGTWTTKKRTKKRASLVNSGSYSINAVPYHGKIVVYNQHKFSAKALGTFCAHPEEMWKQMFSVDSIVEQLKHLDIKRESNDIAFEERNALVHYNIGDDMRNALVLYKRDGTVVPYDGSFGSIRKRRPRPKVDLDQETNRVWKLLMGNINSEGIDGTDDEKAKWWEEERAVFCGRSNSFIARMHLVQGDRRFSPWKGSVVDSVIGVFLTQNVSDHLSSSAFMSLAARFPLKSKNKPCYDERTSLVIEKPIEFIPDSEEGIRWNEVSNQSICGQSSLTIHDIEPDEEQEVVKSSESSESSTGIVTSETEPHTFSQLMASRSTIETSMTRRVSYMVEEGTQIIDGISSQNSVISGQNSVNSPIGQASEKKESCSENISEGEYLTDGSKLNNYNDCRSFMELLRKVGSPLMQDAYSQGNGKMDSLNDHKSPIGVSMVASSNCYWHLTSNSGAVKVDCFDMIPKETQYGDIAKNKKEDSAKDHNALAVETASQITDQNKLTLINQEASRSPMSNNQSCIDIQKDKHTSVQSTAMPVEDPKVTDNSLIQMQNNYLQKNQYLQNLSGETTHITGSTSAFDRQQKNRQKTTESEMIELGYSQSKELNEMKAATRKAKSRRVGNEIRDDVDWDALRKEAEANGKREGTENTMDSLDWEAVRCADVNEIANTIKERGMNNILAERIKNLLNRLVREHGSIDLEWLRDIPPDKAKEYLLSIRGLGLKSVECIRLLTLHHLAFPVDTNVGRIAVRLGWVPLQPLPESLQLHLLELYPVLESIQKYLWPRLCKLDQRTLYELHYQMITFGKVFCTKSKPNCNACPMRGECRHFASAFASARLALPGPEEKSIVSATENISGQNPAVDAAQLPLPLPLPLPQTAKQSEGSQQPEASRLAESKSRITDYEPIIEEPSSPEPVSTQVTENDMEDTFCEDPDEIPIIKLNIEEFTQNLQNYMQENMELQEADMSKALVALTAEAASIPVPKLKNVSRLRTEHQVYELPDSHPLLQRLDRREPDDPCSYLLAIWTPGTLCPILAGVNSEIKQAMSKPCEMLLGKGSESKLCRVKSSEAWVAS
ncbi:DNA glycosylase/AP lyase ROS1 isoform X3 [Populus trichocarpa]|uniref:DNA glycosylase/AP lyase ROS1 isoform X3 n=1 Tax=Populus trichocarpa TaxID=3694 RepID=UPI002277B8A6|nr:DNA glycosylase/AP lyase ROS1 isoform X3 [Populus trichocarpa]